MSRKLKIAKKTFLIASGKGGVGKSTVAVNLSVAVARQGFSVGLLDADIYGPSIPVMMGLRFLNPCIEKTSDDLEKIIPFSKFGVKALSIGFFVEEDRSIVWRGPMLHGTMKKMLSEVDWGDLDFFFIDMPPGTGDLPISLAKLLHIDGALIVTTPQEVATLDAVKAISAFRQLDVATLGVIENMAGFTAPESKETYHIFGEGKAKELADRFKVPLIGSIPLIPSIRQGSDNGFPVAFHRASEGGCCFEELAASFLEAAGMFQSSL